MHDWQVGEIIHGYAAGTFGRDGYWCRRVEGVGVDWIVGRCLANGQVEVAKGDYLPERSDSHPSGDDPCCDYWEIENP